MNGRDESDKAEDMKYDRGMKEENRSFFGLCFSEDMEELAEQSKLALKMIYFVQVLPFYVLHFVSGMALGNIICFTERDGGKWLGLWIHFMSL